MKQFSQRDSKSASLRSHGCGAYAAIAAYQWASGGEVGPTNDATATTAAQNRVDASGATTAQFNSRGLTPPELFASMQAIKERKERPALPVQRRSGVFVPDLIAQLINQEAGALVAVNYGAVQDADKGVGSFRGGHWVFVYPSDLGSVTVIDPLRRQPVKWSEKLLISAMETFGSKPWGNERGEAIVVWQWLTYKELLAIARKQRDEARDQRDTARRERDALKQDANVLTIQALRDDIKDYLGDLEDLNSRLEEAATP